MIDGDVTAADDDGDFLVAQAVGGLDGGGGGGSTGLFGNDVGRAGEEEHGAAQLFFGNEEHVVHTLDADAHRRVIGVAGGEALCGGVDRRLLKSAVSPGTVDGGGAGGLNADHL